MAARLVAEEGLLKGLVLPLDQGDELVIGRDPDECQLLLEDPAASRKHLLSRRTEEGYFLENLSKTNPVQVNDQELSEPRLLKEGDTIKIGSGMFRFFIDPSNNPLAVEQKSVEGAEPLFELNEEQEKAPESEALPLAQEKEDSILEEEAGKDHQFPEINFDLHDTGRWLLKVISGPNHGAEFSMQPNASYIMGTDPNSCDIVFHDTSVSRQHAKITIEGEEALFIEDLSSRNGTTVDGVAIKEKTPLNPNTVISLGTTSFVVYDREGNMQTIISPLLPSIVKVLQREVSQEETSSKDQQTPPLDQSKEPALPIAPAKRKEHPIGGLMLIGIITGLFVIVAIGTTTLFRSEPVITKNIVDTDKILADTLSPYAASIKYSFNKTTGRLVLFGHLLTAQDKTQLLYTLQGFPFIKAIDDNGVVIDEYVWQEINQILNKNPEWKSITIQSPAAGQFVLTGSLTNRKQADQLLEYISSNFPYLDRLEQKVVVEEDIVNQVQTALEQAGIVNTQVSYRNGELYLAGGIDPGRVNVYNSLLENFKKIPGVRNVRSQVSQIAPDQAMKNISSQYEVTGLSRVGNTVSVIVNGRIITKNDMLDGMLITEIGPNTIFLEKDNVKYRIDFSK